MNDMKKSGAATVWVVALISLLLLGIGGSFVWKRATQSLVKDYLLENPEVISDAIANLQKKEAAKKLASAGSGLTKPFAGAVAGASNPDVTIIEFTDYSCGYCRKAVDDVRRLISDDKKIRIVYRELPILTPASRDAAAWALAAAKQGKHEAFHDAMFDKGPPNEGSIRAAAEVAGLNIVQAASDAQSPAVIAEIENNLRMMQQIGFGGTPTFIVDDQVIEGAVGYDALKAAIAKARKS